MYNEGSFYLVLALTSSLGGSFFFILFIVRISDVISRRASQSHKIECLIIDLLLIVNAVNGIIKYTIL